MFRLQVEDNVVEDFLAAACKIVHSADHFQQEAYLVVLVLLSNMSLQALLVLRILGAQLDVSAKNELSERVVVSGEYGCGALGLVDKRYFSKVISFVQNPNALMLSTRLIDHIYDALALAYEVHFSGVFIQLVRLLHDDNLGLRQSCA